MADMRRRAQAVDEKTSEEVSDQKSKHAVKKNRGEYNETDYDRQLRAFTLRDMGKTLFIIAFILVIQGFVLYAYFNNISPADILP